VLDDAVVDQREASGRVWVRVDLGRRAMGRPAGVTYARAAVERSPRQAVLQVPQLALGATALEMPILKRGDAGGIVAAIFQPPQRIHQQRRHRRGSEYADYSAHLPKTNLLLRSE